MELPPAVPEVDEMEGEGIFNCLEFHQSSFFVFFPDGFCGEKMVFKWSCIEVEMAGRIIDVIDVMKFQDTV